MRSCPRDGQCLTCVNLVSSAVGVNKQDRVFRCGMGFNVTVGYDGRYGNRSVAVFPVATDCYRTARPK